MKGLLLKDLYMIKSYCRAYILIVAVFLAVSVSSSNNIFFTFYPCMIIGMIPVTLLGYDEQSRWNEYCGALPYSKSQIVSAKYLIGISAQILLIILSSGVQAVRMVITKTFSSVDLLQIIEMLISLSLITSSISLPFMFKFGIEKGRIAYYVMIGVACAGSFIAANAFGKKEINPQISFNSVLSLICLAAIALYALSWFLSIKFYEKRER